MIFQVLLTLDLKMLEFVGIRFRSRVPSPIDMKQAKVVKVFLLRSLKAQRSAFDLILLKRLSFEKKNHDVPAKRAAETTKEPIKSDPIW